MLKYSPTSFLKILLECINYFFDNGISHDSWKNFLITLIPKNSNSKFRPISLESCTLKFTERLINSRLNYFFEQNKLIPDTQNGFRKVKSCQHALATLITDVHIAWCNKESTCCCALDIKSAFVDVDTVILNNILKKQKIPAKIRKFIFNLNTNRNLYFKIGSNLDGHHIKKNRCSTMMRLESPPMQHLRF